MLVVLIRSIFLDCCSLFSHHKHFFVVVFSSLDMNCMNDYDKMLQHNLATMMVQKDKVIIAHILFEGCKYCRFTLMINAILKNHCFLFLVLITNEEGPPIVILLLNSMCHHCFLFIHIL